MKIIYDTGLYDSRDWFEAYLSKGGKSRLVLVALPYYTWKESFENYTKTRGFLVSWR